MVLGTTGSRKDFNYSISTTRIVYQYLISVTFQCSFGSFNNVICTVKISFFPYTFNLAEF